jgi:DNA-binding NtrC family response regulator
MEKGIVCFLVDDDVDDQEIFSMAVSEVDKSIKCVCANNCVEALEKIESDPSFSPHCIFIDINMPKLNGIDCLKAIQKIDRLSHVPKYMYSTSADPHIIEESKRIGATDFIIKPTSLVELVTILRALIQEQNS